jgi:hypothetical protein
VDRGRAADERSHAPQELARRLAGLGGADDASSGLPRRRDRARAGMGVVFDAGRPRTRASRAGRSSPSRRRARLGAALRAAWSRPRARRAGDRVWVTSDPLIARDTERLLAADEPTGRIALMLTVRGNAGAPLQVVAETTSARAEASSASVLVAASVPASTKPCCAKLAAFGGTPFRVARLDGAGLASGLHLPVSELKALRRALVDALLPAVERGPARALHEGPWVPRLRAAARTLPASRWRPPAEPQLVALCRNAEQLEAVIASGAARSSSTGWSSSVWRAVARARRRQARGHAPTCASRSRVEALRSAARGARARRRCGTGARSCISRRTASPVRSSTAIFAERHQLVRPPALTRASTLTAARPGSRPADGALDAAPPTATIVLTTAGDLPHETASTHPLEGDSFAAAVGPRWRSATPPAAPTR